MPNADFRHACTGTDFLPRLREQTRAAHAAIEFELDLIGPGLGRVMYRQRLARFFGFYQPLEAELHRSSSILAGLNDFAARRKTPLLLADLDHFDVNPAALPLCTRLPELRSAEARYGCLYVLEGATLGGQVIGRHLRERLGIEPHSGGRFFAGYGDRTGSMWHSFRAALAGFAEQSTAPQAIVDAALQTFECLRCWCAEGPLDADEVAVERSEGVTHGA